MNPIQSNPRGYNIHSPFAYHLVTEVLFNSDGIPAEMYNSGTLPESEFQGYLMIVRLLRFFKPSRIVLAGNRFKQLGTIIQQMNLQDTPEMSELKGTVFPGNREFIVWSDESMLMDSLPDKVSGSLWFLDGIHTPGMRKFFSELKNHHNVSQSYELNRFGFVICNYELQKEDYLIRCGKYR